MGNEGQQPPLPPQGTQGQQGYFGWQYDQGQPGPVEQQSPALPPQPPFPGPQQQHHPPLSSLQGQGGQAVPAAPQMPPAPPQQLPPRYQQPVQDMGSSLGYNQGMEYQYFNAPQPSQPLPQLRLQRLQQLREDRMRRQQRRLGPDTLSIFQRRGRQPENRAPVPGAPPVPGQGQPPQIPVEMSPLIPMPPTELSPSLKRQFTAPPFAPRASGPAAVPPAANGLQPALESAQDTGMIQKARIGRAALILTGSFIASRVLGLLRTSMFAYVFGTTLYSDSFVQAFVVPDMIFTIVAGGALSSAFIPVFTNYMVGENDEKTAWHIASSALNLAIVVMMGLALLAIIFAPWLVPLYNPGAPANELQLIISLSRIMFLQSILLGAGVITSSVLNAKQNFLLPAIGTVLYNVGLIGGLIPAIFIVADRSAAHETTAVYLATWGVVIGALLQIAIQVPGIIKVGMRYTFAFDYRHPGVIQIGRQMIPRIINAAMLYVSIFVDRGLISFLSGDTSGGAITQYYQAFLLVSLPLGIFGMAVSTAAFPTLAENVTRGRMDRVRAIITDTLRSIVFMSIPSSIGLIVLSLPIIQVLLQHGAYSLASAEATSIPLAFYAVGLSGLAAVEILTRAFYAMRDSTTPVIISVGQFIFKIALSLLFIQAVVWGIPWGLGGLALGTSLAGLLEAFVLLWLLHQRVGDLSLRPLALFIGRVVLASLAMGAGLLIVRFILDRVIVTTDPLHPTLGTFGTLLALIKLLIELAAGLFIYIRATRLLGIEDFWKQGPVKRVLERLRLSWL